MRIFVNLLFILFCCVVFSQKYDKSKWIYRQRLENLRFSYGLYFGINSYDFKTNHKRYNFGEEVVVENTVGYGVGGLLDYKINNHFYIRFIPTWSQTQRTLVYSYLPEEADQNRVTESSYLNLPVLLKMNFTRMLNIKPYVNIGMSLTAPLSTKNLSVPEASGMLENLYYNAEIGGGVEFFFRYIKITLDLRGVIGLSNELGIENPNSIFNQNLQSIRTRAFLFGIIIQ